MSVHRQVIEWSLSLAAFILTFSHSAMSAPAPGPCSIIDQFAGESQILDRTRTQVVDVTKGAEIPCGGWVNVARGWVRIKHQNGYFIHLAPETFVQLHEGPDPIVIFKGMIFAQAGGGTGEMSILTANSRARVSRGKVIVSFYSLDDETQLITLENVATLENRFAPERKVSVRAGEASGVNLSVQKILPTIPGAVSVSSVRPKMMALHLSEAEQSEAVAQITARKERKFASSPQGMGQTEDRKPASITADARKALNSPGRYTRHQRSRVDEKLKAEMAKRLVGGENLGSQILFPDRFYGKTQQAQITVEDPSAGLGRKKDPKEEAEKQRLMRELSQIRVEQ